MIYPMTAMVALTFVVAGMTLWARIAAARSGELSPGYFRLMQKKEEAEVPAAVVKTGRHFSNLFEMPVLFYVAGTLHIVMQLQSTLALGLAWAFVFFRCVHAFIHLGYNNVMHRLAAFMAANLCVLLLWLLLIIPYG